MIVFDLRCSHGHTFEEWFANRSDYDGRATARDLSCPQCGDTEIDKALSAPRINGGTAAPAPATGPCGLPACAQGSCQSAMGD